MFSDSYRLLASLLAAVLAAALSGCMTLGGVGETPATEPPPSQVEIFFATDRAPDADGSNYYSAERGDLSYGIATIGIPPGHLMGQHEEPSLLKFEWTPDDHKHIKMRDVIPLSENEFVLRLSLTVDESAGGKTMIFVHGYNADFSGAAQVVAQFATDLKFGGPVVLFSWPSHDSLTSYTLDETNAEWASEHFVTLLNTMLEVIPADEIYLVGHSMGNRILGRAVTALASDRPASDLAPFREIVMIAPDIDADVFRQDMAPRISRTGIHTTLYASSNDRALKASKIFHGYPRAGDAGEGLVVVDGVETIDASDTEGGLLGHSYFAEDRRIMEDIFALVQTGQRADNRFGLGPVEQDGKRYWTFRK